MQSRKRWIKAATDAAKIRPHALPWQRAVRQKQLIARKAASDHYRAAKSQKLARA